MLKFSVQLISTPEPRTAYDPISKVRLCWLGLRRWRWFFRLGLGRGRRSGIADLAEFWGLGGFELFEGAGFELGAVVDVDQSAAAAADVRNDLTI
jgi:hypothetical protein